MTDENDTIEQATALESTRVSDSSHTENLLTPFPRRNHLARLRRSRRRRRTRAGAGSVLALSLVLGGTGFAANAATMDEPEKAPKATHTITAAEKVVSKEKRHQANKLAKDTLKEAKSAVKDAASGVDTGKLEGKVDKLGDYKKLSADKTFDLSRSTAKSTRSVEVKTDKAEVEAKKKAEEEKKKAEKERKEAEKRQKAADDADEKTQEDSDSGDAPKGGNSPAEAKESARSIASSSYGWGESEFQCLVKLWDRESGWNYQAKNPSGAFGIPQALPGSKMSSAGSDWSTNATTQVKWGLEYIKGTYGSPCSAWGHSQSNGWY